MAALLNSIEEQLLDKNQQPLSCGYSRAAAHPELNVIIILTTRGAAISSARDVHRSSRVW